MDDDLSEEVGEELLKYGEVRDVVIFEVTTPGYQPEEAVRIFVQFDRVESATKARAQSQAAPALIAGCLQWQSMSALSASGSCLHCTSSWPGGTAG